MSVLGHFKTFGPGGVIFCDRLVAFIKPVIRKSGFLCCSLSGYAFSYLFLSDYEQLLESDLFFSDYEQPWRPAEGDDCG